MAQVGVAGDRPAAAIFRVAGMTAGDDDLELAPLLLHPIESRRRRVLRTDREEAPQQARSAQQAASTHGDHGDASFGIGEENVPAGDRRAERETPSMIDRPASGIEGTAITDPAQRHGVAHLAAISPVCPQKASGGRQPPVSDRREDRGLTPPARPGPQLPE